MHVHTANKIADETPIKHMFRKNQCIFEDRLANPLILLIPNF
ncbi:hypothetical protein D1AOALGA4SA_970 [Olavius algarvensis Delta 1 endosymbiont]|nr:hypothetical protein D1AOALGA4SA_970 [Olavius algarvensis Delta 1 endosymbiont]